MPIIDFTEIPPANGKDGQQDTFELFARDFIQDVLGLTIISPPNRGADGGKDILADEYRNGMMGQTRIRWLISCKHFAFSGKSVTDNDEQNISDRLQQHGATAFMGFYSTIASSGLASRLETYKPKYDIAILDHEHIEKMLLSSNNVELLRRYFPKSFAVWHTTNKSPSLLLDKYEPLPCAVCNKDLLKEPSDGLILFVQKRGTFETDNVVAVCRGLCDDHYSLQMGKQGYITAWEDISDFILPTIYLKKQMALINTLFYKNGPEHFSKHGIEAYKLVLIRLSQLVLRTQTDIERKRVIELSRLEGI